MSNIAHIVLKRYLDYMEGIHGELSINGSFFCYTLERSKFTADCQSNQTNVCCIPSSQDLLVSGSSYSRYDVANKHSSNKFGECIYILSVPNRSNILVHAGNYPNDSQGCILVGESFAYDCEKNCKAIWNSKKTLEELMNELEKYSKIYLKIEEKLGSLV